MSFADYARHGWKLCFVPPGSKGPMAKGWNLPERAIADPTTATELEGAGLLHALSGTCCLDVDDYALAALWLAERGIDLDALLADPRAVKITSGREGRHKLLYATPQPLRTHKPKESGLELRCATANGKSVQDVLPPSIHPVTGRPYEWDIGPLADWQALQPLPPALRALWEGLGATIDTSAPDVPAPAQSAPLAALEAALAEKDPNMEYDEWLKIGMGLHHQTQGSPEGLALWDRWSAGATRQARDGGPAYKGVGALRSHWLSFSSAPGKRVVTGRAILGGDPAADSEFLDLPTPESEAADDESFTVSPAKKKNEAIALLHERLIYVRQAAKYFDKDYRDLIPTAEALQHLFMGGMPKLNGRKLDPVRVLKEHPSKQIADIIAFHPGAAALFHSDGDLCANAYRDVLPAPIEPTAHEVEMLEWLFARLPEKLFADYLRAFLAHVVQKPGLKIRSAPLVWSEITGNGKSTLMGFIPALLVGRRYSMEVGRDFLSSSFNDYLVRAWHVNLTEFHAGTKLERIEMANKLKPWITDDRILVHPKGMPGYSMPNHFFVTASSNREDAAPLEENERRWAICECTAPQMTDAESSDLYEGFLLKPHAAAALRGYFMRQDISAFRPNAEAPRTQSRAHMIEAGLSAEQECLRTAFEERSGPFEKDVARIADIQEYVHSTTRYRPSAEHIGRMLSKPPYNCAKRQIRVGAARYWVMICRNHDKWRAVEGRQVWDHMHNDSVDLADDSAANTLDFLLS